jgi:hypothetical protein
MGLRDAADPRTPDELIADFLRCIETVSPPEVKYSFLRWQLEVEGRDLSRGAVIAVRMATP